MLSACRLPTGGLSAWGAPVGVQRGLSADTSVPSSPGHWGRGLPRAQRGVGGTVWWYSFLQRGNAPLGSVTSWPASETGAWNLGAVIGC